MNPEKAIVDAYDLITGDEDARVCRDIPEEACNDQPRNFFAYLVANLFSKIADELASARLVLPWMLASVGAPVVFSGFLVPIREAGVLLPQLLVAAFIRRMPIRKTVWLWGGALTAVSLLLMSLVAGSLSGSAAGWGIILALVVYSLARGLCSVSAKDVIGKTVSKGRRGVLMGYSASIAGAVTLGFGLYIQWFGMKSAPTALLLGLLVISAVMWLFAIFAFASIQERPGATEGGGNALSTALESLNLLRTDMRLRQFIFVRILLLSVALAPPFYVLLAQQHATGDIAGLGMLIVASGVASFVSSPLWGKMGDRSSRMVMVIAAFAAAVLGVGVFLLVQGDFSLVAQPWLHGIFFLCLSVAHSGVRLGRKVYLVDMATVETRASYVAISNTLIGIVMLAAGVVGVIGDLFDIHSVILLLGLVSLWASIYALRLTEVNH